MSEPFDSIAAVRKEWPSLEWPIRALYLSVPVLIVLGVTAGIVAGKNALFPSHEVDATEPPLRATRIAPDPARQDLVTGLRALPPATFSVSRALAAPDALELGRAIRNDLLAAGWNDDSEVITVSDGTVAPGVTVHMKRSPPGSVFLLNWLNRQGLQARGFSDVPPERTYDVAVEIGAAQGGDVPKK
jgi:hypothetical protein